MNNSGNSRLPPKDIGVSMHPSMRQCAVCRHRKSIGQFVEKGNTCLRCLKGKS